MGYASFFIITSVFSETERVRFPAAIKQLKFPKSMKMIPDEKVKKAAAPLWACGCANMSAKAQVKRGCSKGFAFNSMTSASEYAREKCGEDCIPDCQSQSADNTEEL